MGRFECETESVDTFVSLKKGVKAALNEKGWQFSICICSIFELNHLYIVLYSSSQIKKRNMKNVSSCMSVCFFFGFSSPLSRNKQHIFVIKQIQQIVANTELVPAFFLPQVLCTPTHVHEYIEVSKLLYQNLIQIESPTILGHVHQGKKRCVGRI